MRTKRTNTHLLKEFISQQLYRNIKWEFKCKEKRERVNKYTKKIIYHGSWKARVKLE
jgi:hypothetical protein